ncbi:LuxR C-terminal-related transcriptional regulator [Arthrobacter crystallopoietes]|uniref:AAA ATPase domain-containing protein n=1 Tax=Crystallibacter crystallopoietes TaxID=37928 RepID=A0A1H0ZX79_9MICC|nr:LuxR C-terminal-related transcriptional regulator [Arthrobacter crystallopoietes]AUI51772.1 hypothetical protein AC20117_14210 [Arthrobacter crystallopoietes]SDQ32075.1 AAA ATPase domain-containing protein [Arthrobacter crystallopoietes]
MPPLPTPVGSHSALAESLAKYLAGALAASRPGCGALLIGGPGTGKTFLARDVLHRLHGEVHIEYLRGSPAIERLPYGALNVLLAEVPEAELGHPLAVVRSVASFLHRRSGGKPVLLFVDNAHAIDPLAATVITAMADDGDARLLVCADDARRTPAGLLRLWKDGRLVRTDLADFGVDETAEWLNAVLGPGLTLLAVNALHEASGGNPRLLRRLTREWVESGRLVRCDAGWILTEAWPMAGTAESSRPKTPVEQESAEQTGPGQAAPIATSPAPAVLAAAKQAVFDGRYRDVPAGVVDLLQSRDPTVRLRAGAVLCETQAATGRETAALELAAELLGPAHMAGSSQPGRIAPGLADSSVRTAYRTSGIARGLRLLANQRMWDGFGLMSAAAVPRADSRNSGPPLVHARIWLWIEIAEAVASADAGLADEARAKLRPVLVQLQAGPSDNGQHALAAVAATYISALAGDAQGARAQLCRLPAVVLGAGHTGLSWQQQVWIRYLGAMASAIAASRSGRAAATPGGPGTSIRRAPGNRGEAIARLLQGAAQANTRGALADELLLISGAVRLGATGSAARLATIAGHVQGDFARLCGLFGEGLAREDAGRLFAAAGQAMAQGNRIFAQEAARAGLTIAARQRDTSLMRSALSFILAERRLPDFAPGGGTHDALSGREREIASLAATGAGNAVIARRLHVSIRTVEGHLQQIYRKLQVGPPAVPAGPFA